MKKVLLFVAALFIVGAFASCKKDYTCDCKFTVAGMPDMNIPINDAKKADAKDVCDQAETTYKLADPNVECTLN